jgi:Ras-related protein Rab-8A
MGVIITYAVNDRQTFDEIENWVKQIQLHSSDNIMKVLVGNKSDV